MDFFDAMKIVADFLILKTSSEFIVTKIGFLEVPLSYVRYLIQQFQYSLKSYAYRLHANFCTITR